MTKLEWVSINNGLEFIMFIKSGYKVYPDGYMYLRCSQISKQRIEKREQMWKWYMLYDTISNLLDKWLYSKK